MDYIYLIYFVISVLERVSSSHTHTNDSGVRGIVFFYKNNKMKISKMIQFWEKTLPISFADDVNGFASKQTIILLKITQFRQKCHLEGIRLKTYMYLFHDFI